MNTNEYTWIPFFHKISSWILEPQQTSDQLVQTLSQLEITNLEEKIDPENKNIKEIIDEIDPFTFFSMFIKTKNVQKRIALFEKLAQINNWTDLISPSDFYGIPNIDGRNAKLFPPRYERQKNQTIKPLWDLFYAAAKDQITEQTFDQALKIKHVGFTRLTQSLFYAFPEKYLPIDKQTTPWLKKNGYSVPKGDFKSYQELLNQLKEQESKPFYQISHEAYLENNFWSANEMNYSTLNYDCLEELNLLTPEEKPSLNQILYGPPGTGKTFLTTALAVKIADPKWYESTYYDTEWEIFLHEVKQRYDELVNLGRIVFTTFHQSFCYEDFIEGIRATTVENDQKDSEDAVTNSLSYELQNGVFKTLCGTANACAVYRTDEYTVTSDKKIWKMSLGNTLSDEAEIISQKCFENDYVLLGYGGNINFSDCSTNNEVKAKYERVTGKIYTDSSYHVMAVDTFKNGIKKGDLIIVSDGANKFRAIAEVTGDYIFLEEEKQSHFRQMRTVKWLRRYEPSLPYERLFKKSFSQKTIYNLHGNIDKDKLHELLATDKEEHKPCVMIIDEINRGNISRIFGELITLIEPDKRTGRKDELSVTLPYSKEKFSVPANLYIIGTMNTADRSLTQLDYALRRRFKFVEMHPIPKLLDEIEVHGINIHQLLDTLNQRIEVLLDKDHLIGHSFFIPLAHIDPNEEATKNKVLADIFEFEIIPLLREYFFDDWQRICWVLNHTNLDEQSNSFFKKALIPLSNLFNGTILENLDDRRFSINKKAFHSPESYKNILKT